jgi:hypothetical protein
MRRLMLIGLAPLLLSGCALLLEPTEMRSSSIGPDGMEICRGPIDEPECLTQSRADLPVDGYALTCQEVDEAECQDVAERVAAEVPPRREARWIVVWPESYEVCWEGASESGCSGEAREPASGPVDIDDVLVCEGVDRGACEEAAADALDDVRALGDGSELRALESLTIRSDGSWEACWDRGCQWFVPADLLSTPPPA